MRLIKQLQSCFHVAEQSLTGYTAYGHSSIHLFIHFQISFPYYSEFLTRCKHTDRRKFHFFIPSVVWIMFISEYCCPCKCHHCKVELWLYCISYWLCPWKILEDDFLESPEPLKVSVWHFRLKHCKHSSLFWKVTLNPLCKVPFLSQKINK